ncbi:hypothetical protein BW14_08485 [Bifidobacterium sp. UTBIF-68]|uniref:hypothetical protein n=1 Tax=Bifidobacterium sp. UTBIF-68 TaxID=1465262 RepID=UPI0011270638|nr:hypothetical protein [Bifidobacterium sp. UTBIF-68]TPF92567.1 hypothetical protein BW14_08485 [Bifidobacterium sp. UTBIF-68]
MTTLPGDDGQSDATASGSRSFTPEQVRYLGSLPAVSTVGPNRIRYERGFAAACLKRYRQGAAPTELFRKAGLEPELIGRKRIERCFFRWKERESAILRYAQEDDGWYFIHGDVRTKGAKTESKGASVGEVMWLVPGSVRDRVMEQLVSYNEMLERENKQLRELLAEDEGFRADNMTRRGDLTGGVR